MPDIDILRKKWTEATAALAYGEQRVFADVLKLVADDVKKNLIWGSDYADGGTTACLVNAAGSMLSKGDGAGVPMQQFRNVVALYDQINREFRARDINLDHHVSPLAAEILLQWFAPLKEAPSEVLARESHFKGDEHYVEPTDEVMLNDLLNMLSTEREAPKDVVTPFDTGSEMYDLEDF